MRTVKNFIAIALCFVGNIAIAQEQIIKEGNYTVTGTETLVAGQEIVLKPNVHIASGSNFTATINSDVYIPISLSTDENYVFTRIFQEAMSSTSGIHNNKDVIESVTYIDGLGRPVQQVAIKASPGKKDIVTHVEYDDFGRQEKEYLPFERNTETLGGYAAVTISTDINTYYKSKYPDDFSTVSATSENFNAFSQRIFEPSPLNRIERQGAPGQSWKVTEGSTTDHSIKIEWRTNIEADSIHYFVDYDPTINTRKVTLYSYYNPNQLFITVTKDENWQPDQMYTNDHTTWECMDKKGRTILKRTFSNNTPYDTYYVYDTFNNLAVVIPPKVTINAGSGIDAISDEELDALCYQYKYDNRNRLVEKKIPGKGWEYIVYNLNDKPVLTQDANQRIDNTWLFTKYDALGRVAYTGKHVHPTNITRANLQALANNTDTYEQYVSKQTSGNNIAGTTVYYTNNAIPTGISKVFTINYYDNYTFDKAGLSLPNTTSFGTGIINYNDDAATQFKTKGLATGSKVRVLDTDNWITTLTGYDARGRAIYIITKNEYLNTTDIVETELDFAGKVLRTKTTHTKGSNAPIVTLDIFTYDHVGRLLDQTQQINTHAEERIVSNTYDELGQLQSKKVGGLASSPSGGGTEGGGGLQTVDYTYNVRGWLKKINDDAVNDNDLFNFSIGYDGGSNPLYNGNISSTSWKTANDNTLRSYTYSYDALNRMTSAISDSGRYDVSGITYDKNGNLKELRRKGAQNPEGTSFGSIDFLLYSYDEGNKLTGVFDVYQIDAGFNDGNGSGGGDYTYDANGNMTEDNNKRVSDITYNHLNLPTGLQVIPSSSTGFINYVYDATGSKLEKTVTTSGGVSKTQYAGNYIYKNASPGGEPILTFFNQSEGYIEPENDGTFTYIYQYKDHLGNIRLSYSDRDNDGVVDVLRNSQDTDGDNDYAHEIKEVKDYYPFGMQIQYGSNHPNSLITGRKHNYGFVGKEENNELGLEWLDFGARNYDASIGRWMNIDPLAEAMRRHSPYNYAFNNPVYFMDPDGMMPIGPDKIISTVSNTSKSGSRVKRDISIKMTLTVVNLTGSNLSKTMFGAGEGNISLDNFKGWGQSYTSGAGAYNDGADSSLDNITNFEIDYVVVDNLEDIREDDNVLLVVDELKPVQGDDVVGLNTGRVSAVESGTIEGGRFDKVAQHELAHAAGADHSQTGLMKQGSNSTTVSKKTRGEMTYNLTEYKGDGTYDNSKNNSQFENKTGKEASQDFIKRYVEN